MKKWIVADPKHLGGSPRVRGTRISVALILESLGANMTIAEIIDAFPSLTEEAVRGVLKELAQQQEPQPVWEFLLTPWLQPGGEGSSMDTAVSTAYPSSVKAVETAE